MEGYGMMNFWSLMGVLAVLQNLQNHPLVGYFCRWLELWRDDKNPFHRFRIPQFGDADNSSSSAAMNMEMNEEGSYYNGFQENEMYRMAMTYVGTLKGVSDTEYANVYVSRQTTRNNNAVDRKTKRILCLESGQSVQDEFKGAKVWWTHEKSSPPSQQNSSSSFGSTNGRKGNNPKSFVLKMEKKNKELVLGDYLDHVVSVAEEVQRKRTQVMLYSNRGGGWSPVPFRHPSTFDTIALDSDLMDAIKTDLDTFLKGKSYYNTIGRCWKRGYLFYGPPGTGKSSMIAAMANHLHFDVYDLELSEVYNNSELRNLLIYTRNKSILVIEDIDCTLDSVKKRSSKEEDEDGFGNANGGEWGEFTQPGFDNTNGATASGVTLSGILNCMDGLWSCCGEERIIVFTTNNKDKIDPALLRPGRMDFHVYFPHCSFAAFKLLARNYLSIEDHQLYPLLERAFGAKQDALTPAAVAEIFLKHQSEDPTNVLAAVLDALQTVI